MKTSVWFNGQLMAEDAVPAHTMARAWRYGDGGFETLFFNGSEVPLYEYHLRRAMRHAQLLGIDIRFPEKWEFESVAQRLCRENRIAGAARCRLVWFRESGGQYLPEKNTGIWLAEVLPFDPATVKRIQQAIFYEEQPLVYGKFSPFKKLGATVYVDAARYAKQHGADEALLLNTQGRVAETISANLLLRAGDHFWAPPLTDGGVEGVMLTYLSEHLPTWGYIFERRSFTPAELDDMDEILSANALRGICSLFLPHGKPGASRSLELNRYLPLGIKSKT